MFKIREGQMAALEADYRGRFHQTLLPPLRENLPRQTEGLDDKEMLRRIAAADARAKTYGIVSERGIGQFAALWFYSGPDFDRRPSTNRFLADTRIEPNHRIDTLYDAVMERDRELRGR